MVTFCACLLRHGDTHTPKFGNILVHPEVSLPHPIILSIPVKHPHLSPWLRLFFSLPGMDVPPLCSLLCPDWLISPCSSLSINHLGGVLVYRLKGQHCCWFRELRSSRGDDTNKRARAYNLLFPVNVPPNAPHQQEGRIAFLCWSDEVHIKRFSHLGIFFKTGKALNDWGKTSPALFKT